MTLLAFWARYLTAHDWGVTNLHIIVLFVTIGVALLTYLIMKTTLKGEKWESLVEWKFGSFKLALKTTRLFIWNKCTAKRGAIGLAILFLIGCMSEGSINGIPSGYHEPANAPYHLKVMPRILSVFGCEPFANFANKDVSIKPDNWTGDSAQLALVKGANLRMKDLRYANLSRSFLVNADLSETDLRHGQIGSADLRDAILYYADLREAVLGGSDLRNTYFLSADLHNTYLRYTKLQGANLLSAEGLTRIQLQSAIIDSTTILPDYLKDSIDVKNFGLKP
ncbi:MAG: pentapeptide repeat-containing protein [candidate division Zixibacteria bacterium]|nr:pentapeptide repeat-containing protein [candidate division Zixibacteria bacterium]